MPNHADSTMLPSLFPGRSDRVGLMTEGGPISKQIDPGALFEHLNKHIQGIERCGIYNVLPDDTVRFAVLDFDSHGSDDFKQLDLADTISALCQEELLQANVSCLREVSKSGPGNYHLWLLFEEPLPAAHVRSVLLSLVEHMQRELGEHIDVEIFPEQNALNGGIGNFVWLPLFPPDVKNGRTIFVTAEGILTDPVLSRTSTATFSALANRWANRQNPVDVGLKGPQLRTGILEILANQNVQMDQRHNFLTKLVGHFKGKNLEATETSFLVGEWNSKLQEPLPTEEVHHTVHSLYRNNQLANGFQFELLRGSDIATMEFPEHPFLVRDLFSEHSVNLLAGEEGCGKSLLVMNLALAVAGGAASWLNYKIAKHGKVLYLNNELGFEDFARRLKDMSKGFIGKLDHLVVPKEVPAIIDCWDSLEDTCRDESPCLIIVDCLYFAHDQDENDSSSMKSLMRRFLALRDRYDLAVLLVHHLKKNSRTEKMHNDQMRGSNVFGGITDTVLQIRRSDKDPTKRIIKPTKLRHVGDENRRCRLLSLNPDTLWFSDEGETNEEEHLAQPAPPAARRQITPEQLFGDRKEMSAKNLYLSAKPFGYSDKTVQRLVEDWVRAGQVEKVRRGTYAVKCLPIEVRSRLAS